ncbi:MAG TPA: hypothetical protein VK928_12010 [Longimicrobiales bacterium]|nr:hypothetical protein [Longimicrobiales bacterium]
MSIGRMDPNLLAAFLENRLSPEERRQVIEQLNASPEDYEVFAEAAGLLADLDPGADSAVAGAPDTPPVAPAPAQRRQWWSPRPWMMLPLAAAVAVVLLVRPTLRDEGGLGDMLALATPAELVGATGPGAVAGALGPDWTVTGWSVTRGSDSAGPTDALEFRIGARLADLELALDRLDVTAIRLVAGELAALLDRVPGGALVAERYAGLSDDGSPLDADSARAALAALLGGSAALRLGVWSEQARLAALAGNAAYFDDDALEALRRTAADVPGAAPHVPAIEAAAAAGDMTAMRDAVAGLIHASAD